MMRASHRQPGFLAAMLHRLSGVALAIFLPLHFLALGLALNGAAPLDAFLTVTRQPVVKTAEWALVVALALHMALGLRVLVIEFLPWRDRTVATVTTCIGAGFLVGLLLLLNGA
jgi:fumarate reductase subunit D